jgi:hypothetical protein
MLGACFFAPNRPPARKTDTDMHTEDERYDCTPPQHIPLGRREVPLLEHEHLPLKFARQHHAHLPHHDEPGFARY